MVEIEPRLVRMEIKLDYHEEEIKTLKASADEVKQGLRKIESTLQKIHYLLVGGAIVLVAQQTGLLSALKTLLL